MRRAEFLLNNSRTLEAGETSFYETFWSDSQFKLDYALESAVRERFPSIQMLHFVPEP